MATEIRVPTLGESVSEATIGRWFKKAGDAVKADEPICELETDKVTLEVNAPAAGVLSEIVVKDGETVTPGALLGQISAGGAGAAAPAAKAPSAKAPSDKGEPAKAETAKVEPAKATASAVEGIETGAGYGNHADPAPAAPAAGDTGGVGTDIKVPTLGESVSEATVAKWFKKPGDSVKADEPLVELETDKVTLEVNAPTSGVLASIGVETGSTVTPGAVLGQISASAGGAASTASAPATNGAAPPAPKGAAGTMPPAPSAARMAAEKGIDLSGVEGSGKRGQVLKGDVIAAARAPAPAAARPAPAPAPAPAPRQAPPQTDAEREERVRMTKLRQTIARRLKDAQNTAAMLTTFNEVDMSGVMALRAKYKDVFEKKHGAKLGFMGLFVKAVVGALKELPAVNAEIDGTDIVFKNYYHIGIAVGTEKGLVVPVVRDADGLSLSDIEKTIAGYGKKARDGQLKIEDMQGGTFTITNGGIYGSLMSTPILNAPQSGILGMHKIQDRPIVVGGKVEVRPMMYLALSYDHRIVDGREAVTFLVRVKEALEDPTRLMLDV
ncbi:2-oxoglutarate dehydrogenase complex dihydrolipoyllysine-residue succinyltransferase [Lichenibacterium ramalinae]|uniref:Dihydrolipoyllysine-residue succinyltransferase component of 2-oxoglutarate dehydrogenase complex n=1 Tax=Lichenibacterium ramalinae TaxID=2316527 RepID=A0A4Q2RBX2_9HYPH|nr:2-oxoglutarate dehydrogenase complex dihydrolipoyllysine-residue succinyltransferase [Lichenibacterium ramalinae]RYB03941.1 2-oxoglutarate dehydrogenase complex dihydrolipoyllysine-residue succinyltransferase [Lichenibacterium ramalinae]